MKSATSSSSMLSMGCVESIELALREDGGDRRVCRREISRCSTGGAKVSVVGRKGKVGRRATL